MNFYQGFNNPYYQPQMQRMQQPIQPIGQSIPQPIQQPIQPVQPVQSVQAVGLQGKSVDSIDVVKAMDIPLDGSISYFPLTDGTAIVTKQLQSDGTSKTLIYKPIESQEVEKTPKYITEQEFNEKIKNMDNSKEVKEEIKSIKRQIKDITNDLKDVIDEIKEGKE